MCLEWNLQRKKFQLHWGVMENGNSMANTFSSVQSLSCVWLFETLWTTACQASLSVTNSQSLLKLISIESVMPSNQSHPLLSPSAPAFSLSHHQVFSKESVLRNRWPKYWSFSFSISPSNEHPSYSSLILRMLSACLKIKEMNCMHTKTVPSLRAEMN